MNACGKPQWKIMVENSFRSWGSSCSSDSWESVFLVTSNASYIFQRDCEDTGQKQMTTKEEDRETETYQSYHEAEINKVPKTEYHRWLWDVCNSSEKGKYGGLCGSSY